MFENSKLLEQLARKFILGNRIEAINRVKELKERGIFSTINHTVEHVDTYALAGSATMALHDLMFSIKNHNLHKWATVSVKMSALGMDFDKEYCEENIVSTIKLSGALGVDAQFDAEGPETFPFYYEMMTKYNLHGCIQARSWPFLFEGVHRLPNKPPRLVKGAYKTDIKRSKEDIYNIIVNWADHFLRYKYEAIIGTHDDEIINWLYLKYPTKFKKIELQYLHGVKETTFYNYKLLGFKVREYIPYGEVWYPYLMRRIKEDPWGRFKTLLKVIATNK